MDYRIALLAVLDAAIRSVGATRGNIQLYNPNSRSLEIEVHRGFSEPFLSTFRRVRADEPSACARAYASGRRVLISDVTRDPGFAPYLSIARQAGFRAVQSSPIRTAGAVVGVLSTHFALPTRLTALMESAIDAWTATAGAELERAAFTEPRLPAPPRHALQG